jgi:hypothetical protein
MNRFLHVPDCPVIAEFLRQTRQQYFRLNMTSLWVVAGQPAGLAPNSWVRKSNEVCAHKMKLFRKANGPASSRGKTAALYALDLDDRLEHAYYLHFIKRYKHDAVQAIIREPSHVMAILAICDV